MLQRYLFFSICQVFFSENAYFVNKTGLLLKTFLCKQDFQRLSV
jgi:hypothetical protein